MEVSQSLKVLGEDKAWKSLSKTKLASLWTSQSWEVAGQVHTGNTLGKVKAGKFLGKTKLGSHRASQSLEVSGQNKAGKSLDKSELQLRPLVASVVV